MSLPVSLQTTPESNLVWCFDPDAVGETPRGGRAGAGESLKNDNGRPFNGLPPCERSSELVVLPVANLIVGILAHSQRAAQATIRLLPSRARRRHDHQSSVTDPSLGARALLQLKSSLRPPRGRDQIFRDDRGAPSAKTRAACRAAAGRGSSGRAFWKRTSAGSAHATAYRAIARSSSIVSSKSPERVCTLSSFAQRAPADPVVSAAHLRIAALGGSGPRMTFRSEADLLALVAPRDEQERLG